MALLEDGTVLERPTCSSWPSGSASRVAPAAEHYDLAIVGGGPAGLAAAVYGASRGPEDRDGRARGARRPGRDVERGSRTTSASRRACRGSDLARRATDQARRLGAELLPIQDAVGLRVEGAGRIVELSGGGTL